MNYRIIFIGLLALAGFACGGSTSAPTTPAQIPTSVEYAGGAVTEDISLQTIKSIDFIAKDSSGTAVDSSSVSTSLTKTDGTSADSTYGTCAQSTSDSTRITCTGPSALPSSDVNPRVTYTFTYGSADISADESFEEPSSIEDYVEEEMQFAISQLGNFTARINVSPETIEAGRYAYSAGAFSVSSCLHPNISHNGNGWVFLTCRNQILGGTPLSTPNNGKFCYSNDDGANWSCNTLSDITDTVTVVEAKRTTAVTSETSGYYAYSTSDGFKVTSFTGDSNGTVTIGSSYTAGGGLLDMVLDANGVLHILREPSSNECSGFDPTAFIRNLEYLKLSNGSFSTAKRLNNTNCSVKASRGDLPHLALSSDATTAYASWTDTAGTDGSTLTSVHVAKIDTSNISMQWDKTLTPTSSVSAEIKLSAGQFVSLDRSDNIIVTWDLSYRDAQDAPTSSNSGMNTYLSFFSSGDDSFTTYAVTSIQNISAGSTLQFSGTTNTSTYGNNIIITYRDQNKAYMTMGTISSSGLSTTTPVQISSTDKFAVGPMSVNSDWSGKNFFAVQETNASVENIVVSIGSTN